MIEATTRGYRFAFDDRPRPSTTCSHRSRHSTETTRPHSCGSCSPTCEPAPLDPEVLSRMGRLGPRTRPARTRRSTSARRSGFRAEHRRRQLRQLTDHPRARDDHQSTPAASAAPPGLDLDVRVVADHRHPGRDQRLGILGVEVGDDQVRPLGVSLGQRPGPGSRHGRRRSASPRPCCPAVGPMRRRRPSPSLDRAALAELLAHALRPPPHLDDLGATLAHLANQRARR